MADQLVVPVDVEQALIDELSPQYTIGTGFPPDPMPDLFLRVVAVGGFQRDLVTDKPTVVLEAFAKLETQARDALVDALARVELAVRKGKLGNEVAYTLEIAGLPQNLPLLSVPTHKRYLTTIAPAIRRRVTTI